MKAQDNWKGHETDGLWHDALGFVSLWQNENDFEIMVMTKQNKLFAFKMWWESSFLNAVWKEAKKNINYNTILFKTPQSF